MAAGRYREGRDARRLQPSGSPITGIPEWRRSLGGSFRSGVFLPQREILPHKYSIAQFFDFVKGDFPPREKFAVRYRATPASLQRKTAFPA